MIFDLISFVLLSVMFAHYATSANVAPRSGRGEPVGIDLTAAVAAKFGVGQAVRAAFNSSGFVSASFPVSVAGVNFGHFFDSYECAIQSFVYMWSTSNQPIASFSVVYVFQSAIGAPSFTVQLKGTYTGTEPWIPVTGNVSLSLLGLWYSASDPFAQFLVCLPGEKLDGRGNCPSPKNF